MNGKLGNAILYFNQLSDNFASSTKLDRSIGSMRSIVSVIEKKWKETGFGIFPLSVQSSTQNQDCSHTVRPYNLNLRSTCSGRSRIYQRWGANLKGGGANLLFWLVFPKKSMKIEKNWTERGCVHVILFWISRLSFLSGIYNDFHVCLQLSSSEFSNPVHSISLLLLNIMHYVN